MARQKIICTVPDCGRIELARGLCNRHYLRQQKYGRLTTIKAPAGAGTISAGGYHRITTRDGKIKAIHLLVAEIALGRPLPAGVVVHHVNENRLDNRPENLVICTQSYHMMIHMRMRALAACGNPDWRKCRRCQKYDAPENLRFAGRKRTEIYHAECAAEYMRHRATA